MPAITVRWSEFEARKPYARPFMVSFAGDDRRDAGSVAVNGADLLYYYQFQAAVLELSGELFIDADAELLGDPQRAWLDRMQSLLPETGDITVSPVSAFDDQRGRVFRFSVRTGAARDAIVDARTLLEYQEFQAAVAHQTGCLHRVPAIELIDDEARRRAAWTSILRDTVQRPGAADAMTEAWPWR